jgi:hypothetical protein
MAETDADRLVGWKEIADYIGREPRTAQRWHDERGMPVRRVPGRRGGVFALRAELDAWFNSQEPAEGKVSNGRDDSDPPRVAQPPGVRANATKPRQRRWLLVGAGAAVLVLALGISLSLITRATVLSPDPQSPPVEFQLSGQTLTGLDSHGTIVWSAELPDSRFGSVAGAGLHSVIQQAQAVDLNGDGRIEVIARVYYQDMASEGRPFVDSEVFAFASDGSLLWRYRPELSFTFSGSEFAGPWYPGTMRACPGDEVVWAAFAHRTWWPSFLVSIGPGAAERLAFVNAGHINAVRTIQRASRKIVLAGGINNEQMLPALAAFEADGPPVTSPQTPGSPFECDDCPEGRPLKYLLFPRTDVNVALGKPFVSVTAIDRPDDGGIIEVDVRETSRSLRMVYRLSLDLEPLSVGFSDYYWVVHRELSEAGQIAHSAEDCPERHDGVVVRIWEPETGWRDERVPPTFPSKGAPDPADR